MGVVVFPVVNNNLVTLCRYHHRELHKGSFQLVMQDNELVFTKTSGELIAGSFTPQFPEYVFAEASGQFLRQHWPMVDRTSAVGNWRGEKMDMDMAVEGLSRR